MSLVLVTALFGDCEVHLKRAQTALNTFTSSNTAEYYIKWSNITTMHLGFYKACLIIEQSDIIAKNHVEVMKKLETISTKEAVVIKQPKNENYGTGY